MDGTRLTFDEVQSDLAEQDREWKLRDEERRRQAERLLVEARNAAIERKTVRKELRTVESLRTRIRGDPLAVLSSTRVLGRELLVYQPNPPAGGFGGFVEEIFGGGPGGTWRSPFDPQVVFHGTATSCEELQWGVPVGRVIATSLDELHAREAQLAAVVTASPRRRSSNTKKPAPPRASTARNRSGQTASRRPPRAMPEHVRCSGCGRNYKSRGWLGPRLTCPFCNAPAPYT